MIPKLERILKTLLPTLAKEILDSAENNKFLVDEDRTFNDLKEMLEALYEGVNLPCMEQALLERVFNVFYYQTSKITKVYFTFIE